MIEKNHIVILGHILHFMNEVKHKNFLVIKSKDTNAIRKNKWLIEIQLVSTVYKFELVGIVL